MKVIGYQTIFQIKRLTASGMKVSVIAFILMEDLSIKKTIKDYNIVEGDTITLTNGDDNAKKILEILGKEHTK